MATFLLIINACSTEKPLLRLQAMADPKTDRGRGVKKKTDVQKCIKKHVRWWIQSIERVLAPRSSPWEWHKRKKQQKFRAQLVPRLRPSFHTSVNNRQFTFSWQWHVGHDKFYSVAC
jgi:hypothetical protein